MKIRRRDRAAFAEYLKPLRCLERSFQSAGVPVEFIARNWLDLGKTIYVDYPFCKHRITQSIEGDSPTQAVKDVARAVIP
ncbi:MAG: hypothetical protein LBK08_04130 [Treponema sp.]|jgi:hypothetical protein|nr:hypothetical protein [Treponema sp.]